jgi:hypothetical protein
LAIEVKVSEERIEEVEMRYGRQRRKSGEREEDILPIGGKSEEEADLKNYLKMLQNLRRATSELFK